MDRLRFVGGQNAPPRTGASPDWSGVAAGARTISYLYDFGDSWDHKIRIGKISEPVPGDIYPA